MRSVSTTLNPDRKPASEEQMRSLIPQLRLELASLVSEFLPLLTDTQNALVSLLVTQTHIHTPPFL